MYCQKCGNSVSSGLNYCKNCGRKVGSEVEDKEGTPGKMLHNVLETIFLVVMFGMGILVGLVAVLLNANVGPELVGVIAVVHLVAVFGICFLLARQVPKLIDAKLAKGNNAHSAEIPQTLKQAVLARD